MSGVGAWTAGGYGVVVVLVASLAVMASLDGPQGEAELQQVRAAFATAFWTTGILVALGYGAAGWGLHQDRAWGRGAAYMLMPLTFVLFPVGTVVAIVQAVRLPRRR